MRLAQRKPKYPCGYDPEPELEACGWCVFTKPAHGGKFWCVRDPRHLFRVGRYGRCDHCTLPGWEKAVAGGEC